MYNNIYIITSSNRDLSFLSEVCEIIKFSKKENFEFSAEDDDLVFYFPDGTLITNPPVINAKNLLNFNFEGIELASNKIECRKKLAKENIPIPKTWYKISEAQVPYIIRKQYHSMGLETKIIKRKIDHEKRKKIIRAKDKLYFSELINVRREYRAFVLNNKILLIFDRDWKGSIEKTLKEREQIRRRRRDFSRIEASSKIKIEDQEVCINAMKAINLDYGAVDFVIDKKDNIYVLEINTRPFMDGQIVKDALKKAFKDLKDGKQIKPFQYEVK